ncbi:alpha/beta fold hydrolase [Sphingobacterium sp. DK4209]|uniref:Alpha/beta fold hydrolase n=1 Tax=Sphingobacterium zhuxiongii TaxID=2662364 RepID=A0A5Q0Q9D1_9SPHI|nr:MULTISPECIES: alpha/beta hydrolase [unclassified Sphingobacterium]MVZ65196.1 alpha/beta fold hydrolase [Sphingobacterium sp. DK4209]QGA26143.1 alpha/beta fold hydrolase [Sphingobacterium sp. dk4302]
MRHFLLFFLLFSVVLSQAQSPDSTLLKQFDFDKARYQEFEKNHRRTVKTKHVALSYLHWGKASNPAFIWLHGSYLDAYDFEPFAQHLVDLGYQVLSIDHYGHGKTGFPSKDLSFEDFANDLSALMDSLALPNAVVGGFSRGGYLASSFYKQHPKRVKALVLEDGGSARFYGHFYKLNAKEQGTILSSFNLSTEMSDFLLGATATPFEQYKRFYEAEGEPSQYKILSVIKRKGDKYITYQGLNTYYGLQDSSHAAQALFAPETTSRYVRSIVQQNPIEIYQQLTVPMLLMEATKSPDAFPQDVENNLLSESHPDLIAHKKFPNASHNIHYECTAEFIVTLLDFLSEIKAKQ